ncbi:unnamed protein product [Rhizoctonia solani]|uniref:Serine aminopeptidase S33 domain-containing protein n=1 Tax=Rhizoctonia solani TaxID=456999 RepID=A0A8H2WK66_9AGAM|nr:unnamed protein product [Rhizoctonia solani]
MTYIRPEPVAPVMGSLLKPPPMRFFYTVSRGSWAVLYRSERRNDNLLRSGWRSSFDRVWVRKLVRGGSVPVPASALFAVSNSSAVPSPWVVAGAVVGLPLALWAYKCLMMVLFQRKIIYMGNAGNPLHRIPKFRLLAGKLIVDNLEREVQVIAVAPRSYWTSTKTSPSEAGFLSDYTAVLEWISNAYPNSPVVLYGHSIGGSIAVKLLASLPASTRVRGLVVENAFTSVPAMVRTVYPSKWLPYYHLGPLVFDKWDALSTLSHERSSALRNVILHPPSILIINSENDELVPAEMGREMFDAASFVYHGLSKPLGTGPRRVLIPGALHDDAFTKRQWKDEMRAYLTKVATVDTYRQ